MSVAPASAAGLFAALLGADPSRVLFATTGGRDITAGQVRRAGQDLAERIARWRAAGKRIAFDGERRAVIDGPFAETRELVAGYWIWEVKDMDEAVAWVKRCPNPMPGPSEIEIRPFYEMADFAEIMTPEAEAVHGRVADKLAEQG